MLDEERVERDPVAFRDDLPEANLGLLGRAGPDDPESVRDAVDMRVDGDRRDPVAENEDAVRGLGSHARERSELVERPGHGPAEPVDDLASALADHARLDVVEAGRPDQRLDLAGPRGGEARRVRVAGEEARAREIGVLVARTLGEDRSDQDLERVLRVVPKVGSPPIAPTVERGEPIEERLPVCLLYTSPSPRDPKTSRMPSSA